ncbi:TPA: hypothetical protein EYP75_03960 [Candidatus Bathyarchaeota archaeon]|nr:hypothetical protein [Candidatus Bathyarchaeota archaeon]
MKKSSKIVSLTGVFAALHAVLYLITPVELWRSWSIYLEPLEGLILGPWAGFLAALLGSLVARTIKPTDLWMFGIIAEPMGVLACGLIAKKRWKPLLLIYAIMLGAYFAHPLGRELPLWTILDILAASVLIYPVTGVAKNLFNEDANRLPFIISMVAFIGTVTDSLTRVFLLVPAGLYVILGWPSEVVRVAFIMGAADSYIEDVLVIIVTFIIGTPIVLALRKIPGMKYPLS